MRKHLQIDVEHGRIIAPDIHDVRLRLEWPRKVVQIMVRKINTINRHKSVPRVEDAISFPHSLKRLKIKATQQLVVAAENSMFLSCLSDVFYNFFLSQPELDFIFSFFCLSSSRVRKKKLFNSVEISFNGCTLWMDFYVVVIEESLRFECEAAACVKACITRSANRELPC